MEDTERLYYEEGREKQTGFRLSGILFSGGPERTRMKKGFSRARPG